MQSIVVISVQQARWIDPQPSLVLTLILALVAGLFFARSKLSAKIAHPAAILLGLALIFLQIASLYPDAGLISKGAHLIRDLQAWWSTLKYNEPSPVTVQVAFMFGFLAWIIGYFSAWSVIKKRSPWLSVTLSTIAILVSLNFQGSDKYYFFILYIFAALIFIGVINFLKHSSWSKNFQPFSTRSGWFYWISVALVIMVITVFISWHTPQVKVYAIESFARAHNPWREKIELYWQNFFAPVPGTVPGLAHGGHGDLQFGGSLETTDQVIFIVGTDESHYWKTQIYDYYDGTGWKVGETREVQVPKDVAVPSLATPTSANQVSYTELTYNLSPQVTTDVIPAPGELISGDIPIVERTLEPLLFTIDMEDRTSDSLLPADIRSMAESLRAMRYFFNRNTRQISARLPQGIRLVDVKRENNQVKSIIIARNANDDEEAVSLASFDPMKAQKSYQIRVRVPGEISADKLMASSADYPPDIADRYLQLPEDFPQRVRELADSLTADAKNAYEKAVAIKTYLAKIPYSLKIETPPPDADGVDYFLFTQKSGYCVYFASAMAVMLRSTGIPARMVVGFLPGQHDAEQHRYIIRDRDYHAWTEVYFPGYGWIKFDPTPSAPAIVPGGSNPEPGWDYPYYPFLYDWEQSGEPGTRPAAAPVRQNDYTPYIIFSVSAVVFLVFFLGWFLVYRRPGRNSALYSRMVILSSLAGIGPRPWQTSLEFAHQLASLLPEHAPGINEITSVYLQIRYGKQPLESAPRKDLTEAWKNLRHTLLKRLFRIG
jgi:transglutaminase-like putative cysteine protease